MLKFNALLKRHLRSIADDDLGGILIGHGHLGLVKSGSVGVGVVRL